MPIIEVQIGAPEFDAVIELWRANSGTLGFMPRGGFEDAAQGRTLLAAIEGKGTLTGYVLFRLTQYSAVIAHLCVTPANRGKGVARMLLEAVKDRSGRAFDIRLSCRRDFAVAQMWPKLGFVAAGDKPGRGKDGIPLTLWRYDLAAPPLLELLSKAPLKEGTVRAAIDANVFFGLESNGMQDEEARALAADWLAESLDLLVTDELFNEIERSTDATTRQRQRARANSFQRVPRAYSKEEELFPKVLSLVAAPDSPSAQSDARQIAMTIAGEVMLFVTCDQGLLARADALDNEFGVQVKAPFEVIREFDELRRQPAYRPRRLFWGPTIRATTARADDIEHLADLMHVGQPSPEPRRTTIARLRSYLSQPDRFEATCISKGDVLLAAYIIERPAPDLLTVPFFGVAASTLGNTAARHYLQEIAATAAREKRTVIDLVEAGRRVRDALEELSFSKASDGTWVRIGLAAAWTAGETTAALANIATRYPRTKEVAARATALLTQASYGPPHSALAITAAERLLWPLKLTEGDVPTFIVPIQPRWARELFDRELAAGTLFGASPHLVLNAENVYYRAARPKVITAPSRVLWYVSEDDRTPGTKAVRACSRIDEVVVGRPKELFSRFRRLGIYEWSDVFNTANEDLSTEIMAFRFSGTELFSRPIPWHRLQETLVASTGKTSPVMSPVEISEACFQDLYRAGVGGDAE